MPELPEVQTVVTTLRQFVLNARITSAILLRTDICIPSGIDLPAKLTGRSISAIDRRAKRIVFTLDTGERFYIHLGMTGQLLVVDPQTPVAKHTHLIADCRLRIADSKAGAPGKPYAIAQLRFVDPRRFGGIWWLGESADDPNALGPEPLTLRTAALAKRLARPRRPIKSALLDQSLIAGLGNIYVDEALFAAGLHPLTLACDLSPAQVAKLSRAIKQTLRSAIQAGGSTLRDYVNANGQRGQYQSRHRVYDRANQPCRRCKTPIARIVLGGRSTHFCPQCQNRD